MIDSKLAAPALSAFASHKRQLQRFGGHSSFVDDLKLQHGPRDALGRFFLRAEEALENLGIRLSLGSFEELAALYGDHAATWGELVPLFDHRACEIDDRSLCLLGRDADGEIVTAIATRYFDLGGSSLKEEMESLRFFFPGRDTSAMAADDIRITAPSAARIDGALSYTGGFWVRPDHRGRQLPWILPQIARNYAVTAWNVPYDLSVGKRGFLRADVARMYHYNIVEEAFEFLREGRTHYEGVLVCADRTQIDADLAAYAANLPLPILGGEGLLGDRGGANDRVSTGR